MVDAQLASLKAQNQIVTVVLAAGLGSRIGGPKARLLVRTEEGAEMPLIEAVCTERLAAESGRVIAVVRQDVADLVGDRLRDIGAETLVSTFSDDLGPAGSIAKAVWYLAKEAPRIVVVTPVDMRVSAETVASLCLPLAFAPSLPLATVPRLNGRRGHPVALRFEALRPFLGEFPPTLRETLERLASGVLDIDTQDASVRENLNLKAQTAALLRMTGHAQPVFWKPRATPVANPH